MKKIKMIFLITILLNVLSFMTVHAEENATFYEADYIDDIYMSKYEYQTGTIYYQKARFFRKSGTDEFAYCIEPFRFFEDGSNYHSSSIINNLNDYQLNKIKKIAHFGYQYGNHTDTKWYAITQMMIWKEAGSSLGDFYFTDSLNGNRIDAFREEMDEIEYLIKEYDTDPFYNSNTSQLLENSSMGIYVGSIINYYQSPSENIIIKNGTVQIKGLKEGYYEFELVREEDHNSPILIFSSENSQTLMQRGDLENKKTILKIDVHKSIITIHKKDLDTQENTPQGEGNLDGAVYGIYNQRNDALIAELTIQNNEAKVESIISGNYYIQEIKPGEGYQLDPEKYPFTLNNKEYIHHFELNNKIIEKKIKIKKLYGEIENLQGEKEIQFEIYNQKKELVNTITTNELGEAEILLPYGTYTVKQVNTTEGYEKTEDFQITIQDTEEIVIERIDYKIPVPNTYKKEMNIIEWLLSIIVEFLF